MNGSAVGRDGISPGKLEADWNALAALLLKKGRPGIVFTYKLFTHLALRFFWRRSVTGVLYV